MDESAKPKRRRARRSAQPLDAGGSLSSPQLQDALTSSSLPAAQHAAEMLRTGQAQVTTRAVRHSELIDTLRVRRDIKRGAAEAGVQNVVKLREALEEIVAWWDANPQEMLFYDNVTTDSAVSFIFWRQASTGIVLAGFETRDATKLTEDDGRKFWGPDWRPPYSGI